MEKDKIPEEPRFVKRLSLKSVTGKSCFKFQISNDVI